MQRVTLGVPPRALALLDQALLSGANLLVFLIVARTLAPGDWGSFSFAYASVLFAQGFQRAMVTIPLITFASTPETWHATRIAWRRRNVALALCGTGAMTTAAALAWAANVTWLARSAAMAAVMLIPMFAQEFARRSAAQDQRFGLLAMMALAYATVATAGAVALRAFNLPAWTPALLVACAALVASMTFTWCARQPWFSAPRLAPAGPEYAPFAAWASLSHLAYSGYNYGAQALLGALAGPAALGVFHACRILIQPVNTLVGAMDSIDKPRAAAAFATVGAPAMHRVLLKGARILTGVSVPYLLVLALFAPAILPVALGPTYAGQSEVVWAWCLTALGMVLTQPIESGLYVARRTREMFLARVLASVAVVALCLWLIPPLGATGALIGMAVGFLVTTVLGALTLARLRTGD